MKVRKHYEQGHVMIYVEEGELETCITLDNDQQMRRLGECLSYLGKTGAMRMSIEPREDK